MEFDHLTFAIFKYSYSILTKTSTRFGLLFFAISSHKIRHRSASVGIGCHRRSGVA